MSAVYEFFAITRQAHHQQMCRQSKRNAIEQALLDRVRAARVLHPRIGARKLAVMLAPMPIGITAFERLVAATGLSVPRLHRQIRTTLRSSDGEIISNLTHGLRLTGINQLWVSDISYLVDGWQTYYLVHLLDVYSRRLLAVSIATTMKAEENLACLEHSIALRQGCSLAGLIHHSDAGSQYTSAAYLAALAAADIRPSIAETCLQNAYSERLNGTIKNEYLRASLGSGLTLGQWRRRLADVEVLYNYHRPHQQLGYRSPVAFENYILSLPRSERPILELHDFQQAATDADSASHAPSPQETGDTSCQPIA